VNKSEIRKKILKIRKYNKYKNLIIDFQKLLKIVKKEKIKGKIVGGYYPYNYEVNIMDILEKFEKQNYQISLPKIREKFKMNFYHWSKKEPLTINKYGIPEPTSNLKKHPNILLVPLVAFDKNLNRIGYGGGFYDRYISRFKKKKNFVTIGLAYSFQKVERILIDKYDIKLDYIITEKKIG
jgi:5-formyltetrahydrofolate cyclo-ligase